jgi:hypothetical protein
MKTIKEYLNEGLIRRQAGMDMRTKIEAWLKKYDIRNYIINDDLTIDVNEDVNLIRYPEEKLPEYIRFRKVREDFSISKSPELDSLEGCPEEVGGSFWCNGCPKLKSLERCPKKVGSCFYCFKCGERFTEDGVKKACRVKKYILVV